MELDLDKAKRESLRWLILLVLDKARPLPVSEQLILSVVGDSRQSATAQELRRELDYLESRKLIELTGRNGPVWTAELTRHGVDVAEYTVDCEPGIARPKKYW